ncbi:MAG: hypothetical protein ACW98D_00700 [Promethearchaeota archaeon]
MSSGENKEQGMVTCCVMNCQEEISLENAVKIKDQYFCKLCGVAYYRSSLNL